MGSFDRQPEGGGFLEFGKGHRAGDRHRSRGDQIAGNRLHGVGVQMVGEGMVMGVVPAGVSMGGVTGRMGVVRMGFMSLDLAGIMVEVVVVR